MTRMMPLHAVMSAVVTRRMNDTGSWQQADWCCRLPVPRTQPTACQTPVSHPSSNTVLIIPARLSFYRPAAIHMAKNILNDSHSFVSRETALLW
jgi:hypothetical protein